MLTIFFAAVEEAAHEEHDATLFYVVGGIAAAWAILLFAVGMRAPSFPGSAAAQRLVMLVSVLVVAGAMASAVLSG